MQIHQRPDRAQIEALLLEAGLPTADLGPDLHGFFACGPPEHPAGVVGLELHGRQALLRSLAVAPAHRGKGCGRVLFAAAENHARAQNVDTIYLLTETATEFFAALGYRLADRGDAPPAIRRSREFSELCPDSATFMVKHLG